MTKQKLKMTADGSVTLYLPDMDEQYHSLNGAVTEAQYVYIERGYMSHKETKAIVFEVGLGTGLNCFLTAVRSADLQRDTTYYSVEAFPVSSALIKHLNYTHLFGEKYASLFFSIHESPWEEYISLTPYFRLFKIRADFTKGSWNKFNGCNVIYYDAFGPDKQPEMWSSEIFSSLYNVTLPGGIIVTYSAKGTVRRGLSDAGFRMKRLPGPPGKKEMLRGIKVESNI